MPEQLLAPADEVEEDDHESEAGRQEAIDLTVLLALREPCTDVEALDLTADRLRRLQDAFTKAADDSASARTATPNGTTTPMEPIRCARTTNPRTTPSSGTHATGHRSAPAADPTHRTSQSCWHRHPHE
ncbi:hypothetical protein ACFQ3Z_45085 [Streptomyces nogalater]